MMGKTDTLSPQEISFEHHLKSEILENERLRNLIVAIIFAILLTIAITVSIIYHREFNSYFGDSINFHWITLFSLIIVIRSLNIRRILGRLHEKQKYIPKYMSFINSFFEISMITLVMIIIAQYITSIYILITPLPYLYFLFIILTTLDLDYRLSVFTGFVASFEYILLSMYFFYSSTVPITIPVLKVEAAYLAKGGILLLAGFVAGLIAREIRKRIYRSYQATQLRNDLEVLFGQQVSPAILDEIITSKQKIISKKIPVCVMFLDIEGFTPFAENKPPEEIIQYQNDVFSIMIECITNQRGIINQFMGDGFMATFGAPLPSRDDCLNAVSAAVEINDRLNSESHAGNIPETNIRIGIHHGEVVTGNVGNETRKQYSVTGNTVILAARLEQLNKMYESIVLVSQEVLSQIDKDVFQHQSLGSVSIKGRTEPMEVFKII